MGYLSTPEEKARKQTIIDDIITPKDAELPLRAMIVAHMQRLVHDNNANIAAKIHYLDTGEFTLDTAREFAQFVNRNDSPIVGRIKTLLNGQALFLKDLDPLSDAALLAAYGDLLLALRERRLPDALPA